MDELHEGSQKPVDEQPEQHAVESMITEDVSPDEEQQEERGRRPHRTTSRDFEPDSLDEVDEILNEVRSRLFSVQKIVRREQSGSSQARDDMMDELGTMLDNAIATTMTPLLVSHPLTRGPSLKRPSPKKQSPVPSHLGRSQSVKISSSSPLKTNQASSSLVISQLNSPAQKIPQLQIPDNAYRSITSIETRRRRQSSEPGVFIPRRTGFPLASPVRERALL